jgi:pilus assembly protein CpaC
VARAAPLSEPTVIDEDHIRLELEPEVSTIDFANGVRFNGFVIPALRTRRARTGVELRDGQSFALAGLLDNNETRSLSKIPVIGDIPILGNLFKSSSFQKQETELMFIITAELVKPINSDEIPQMKGVDGLKSGSPLGVEPQGDGISGNSGFSNGTGEATDKAATMLPAVTPAAPTAAPVTTPVTGTPATTPVTTPATEAKPKVAAPQPGMTPGTNKGATP